MRLSEPKQLYRCVIWARSFRLYVDIKYTGINGSVGCEPSAGMIDRGLAQKPGAALLVGGTELPRRKIVPTRLLNFYAFDFTFRLQNFQDLDFQTLTLI